jgi:hypothetical protein
MKKINKHDECKPQFYCLHKAYYNENKNAEKTIMVGMYHPGGGTTGEFSFTWEELQKGKLSCRVELWDESWDFFSVFSELFSKLEKLTEYPTEEQIVELLLSLGFTDRTQYKRPENDDELIKCFAVKVFYKDGKKELVLRDATDQKSLIADAQQDDDIQTIRILGVVTGIDSYLLNAKLR